MKDKAKAVALEFAQHLMAGRFESAHGLLSSSEQMSMSIAELKDTYLGMGSYDGGKLTEAEAMVGLDDWPAKMKDDICTFYISIAGKSAVHEGWICEAIAGVLKNESDSIRIHCLEWGRP